MGKENPLRNLLNRLLWDSEIDPSDYEIVFISRGAPNDMEIICGSALVKVWARGFEAKVREGTKYVPFHRIIEIRNRKTGEVIFRSPRLAR